MATIQKKTVLITGCSAGGIGSALAKNFHHRGFYVFATARDTSKVTELSDLSDIEILELDVTIPNTISKCRETVSKRTAGKLDILINNAGVDFQSPLLDLDVEKARGVYDVNVWGTLAMTQAFAPLVIEAKGVIVNQSSIDAALNMAWAGIFASSKAAVARLSETLRVELEPLGVRVVTVMCGSVNTPMFTKPSGKLNLPETSFYHCVQQKSYEERMDHQKKAMHVDVVAEKLAKEILGGSKGLVWRGSMASLVRFITWVLPGWLTDRMVNTERGVSLVTRFSGRLN